MLLVGSAASRQSKYAEDCKRMPVVLVGELVLVHELDVNCRQPPVTHTRTLQGNGRRSTCPSEDLLPRPRSQSPPGIEPVRPFGGSLINKET